MTRPARILALSCGAAGLALLDVTVVNLAIPALSHAYPGTTVTAPSATSASRGPDPIAAIVPPTTWIQPGRRSSVPATTVSAVRST